MRHPLRFAMFAGLVVLAGCGGEAPEPARGADTVVLRVEQLPGMAPLSAKVTPPQFSLYGDGRALVLDGYDGALPRVTSSQLSDREMAEVFEQAAEVGVFEDHDFDTDVIDAGELRITARTTDETRELVVPGGSDGGEEITEFGEELMRPAESTEQYRAERLGIFFLPADGEPGAKRWPLPVPGEDGQLPCITVDGTTLDRAQTLARSTGQGTVWRHGGRSFEVVYRPLLPEEPECAAARRSA